MAGSSLSTGRRSLLVELVCFVFLLDVEQLLIVNTASVTGTQFTVVDTKGTTYLIYSLSSITLTATSVSSTSGTIRASGTFTGVLRLVQLSQSGHKALLDQYYQTYPTSVGLDYSFTTTTGTLIYNWNTVGDGSKLLLLTWPHHRLTMQSPNFPATSSLAYLTTKVSPLLPSSSFLMS
jgi:endo-1,3(4)-beta-glucanase